MARPGSRDSGRLPVERLHAGAIDIDEFATQCGEIAESADYQFAHTVEANIPVYSGADVRRVVADGTDRVALMDEWANCLANGAGVFAVSGAFGNLRAVDAMTDLFRQVVAAESVDHPPPADHFAEAGANTRVWNILQKSAVANPEVFAAYYSNVVVALAAEAWLGPWYQLSAQVNIVHPGGSSQHPHRDYHLGFQVDSDVARFPAHAHLLSQALTLQAGIAHCDMPIESGPTRVLPYSQRYTAGYMAWRDERFVEFFEENSVQLPLAKGDAVFFNPGLHHAAGANRTDSSERVVNLLQISSAMGRPMEAIDTYEISKSVYPVARRMIRSGALSIEEVDALIAASADGYSFPTNLDTDPPSDGMAPRTAQRIMSVALNEDWSTTRFSEAFASHRAKREA